MTSFINLQRRNLLKYTAIGIANAATYLNRMSFYYVFSTTKIEVIPCIT